MSRFRDGAHVSCLDRKRSRRVLPLADWLSTDAGVSVLDRGRRESGVGPEANRGAGGGRTESLVSDSRARRAGRVRRRRFGKRVPAAGPG